MLEISTRVPQGSLLAPLLFTIYINDMANVSIYADDTTLSSILNLFKSNLTVASEINSELGKLSLFVIILYSHYSCIFKTTHF